MGELLTWALIMIFIGCNAALIWDLAGQIGGHEDER